MDINLIPLLGAACFLTVSPDAEATSIFYSRELPPLYPALILTF